MIEKESVAKNMTERKLVPKKWLKRKLVAIKMAEKEANIRLQRERQIPKARS